MFFDLIKFSILMPKSNQVQLHTWTPSMWKISSHKGPGLNLDHVQHHIF